MSKVLKTERKAVLTAQRDTIVVPPVYRKKRPPQRMLDRGIVSAIP